MIRILTVLLLVIVIGGAATAWWFKFERQPPVAEMLDAGAAAGGRMAFRVAVRAPASPGLKSLRVQLRAGDSVVPLLEKTYDPAQGTLGRGVLDDVAAVDADLRALGVPEGPATIEALADTYGWRLSQAGPRTVAEHPVEIDLTPPKAALVSTQHNMRLGGAAVVVFRATGATEAEVRVGPYAFAATNGLFADPDAWVGIFAVPQDLDPTAVALVRATDAVGNATEVPVPIAVKGRTFPTRTLALSDTFLARKVPELHAAHGLPVPDDLVTGYLFINRTMRQQSEERLHELAAQSATRPLWDGAFLRQPNAAAMSAFADRRAYAYGGDIIDRQTHLGYDLASLRAADVVAAQNGIVVLAEDLGIYGNTVVIDHGLGVFSLYGHLSAIAVDQGTPVAAGAVIGQTGETGLAGGDHLHFSIMVRGTHVDPVEWWDPAWIRDHVTAKLSLLPAASSASAAAPPARPEGAAADAPATAATTAPSAPSRSDPPVPVAPPVPDRAGARSAAGASA